MTEVDIIDQIKVLYEKDGRKATAVEEAEWLTNIREADLKQEEEC